jgi:hypothetical protein
MVCLFNDAVTTGYTAPNEAQIYINGQWRGNEFWGGGGGEIPAWGTVVFNQTRGEGE